MKDKLLIDCRDVSLGYEGHAIGSHLNFQVHSGEYLCIVGENGSGKSTLLKCLLGLLKPSGGSIHLLGQEMNAKNRLELLRQTEGVRLFDTSFGRIVAGNPNVIKPREQRPNREKFQQLLDSHGLFYAVEHSKPILTRIKAKFKRK